MTSVDRYNGPPPATGTASNGAVVSQELLGTRGRSSARRPELIRLTDQVSTFVGGSIVNRTFIEGADGVIVYDAGDDYADGQRALEQLRTITDKPVVAVVYSHNHYAHGTAAFIDEGNTPIVIGHPEVNANLYGGTHTVDFPEATPVLMQRLNRQFAAYLPDSGPDAPYGARMPGFSKKGTVPVDHEVSNGQELTVAGVRMQFFTDHKSDSDDTLTMWLPDLGVVLNNFLWPSIPNFYALRGTGFRDPRSWRDGVRLIRNLRPDVLVNTHALPITGAAEIERTLDNYADAIAYIFDQSLRGITHGLGPSDLRTFVKLPSYLTDDPHNSEGYGEVQYQPPYIYERIFGWYDGVPEHINPAPLELAGTRIVEGFGGREPVLAAVQDAIDRGEHSWAAELAGHLVRAYPNDKECRAAKAHALRLLAQRARGSIARHFYLSHALELEDQVVIPPAKEPSTRAILANPPATYIDYQRIRLDPSKSGDADTFVAITLTDKGVQHGLHVRRGVCEFVPDVARHTKEPDIAIELTHLTWARLYCGDLTWDAAFAAGDVAGVRTADTLVNFFAMFDQPTPIPTGH